MVFVTHDQLAQVLRGINRAESATITAKTPVAIVAKHPETGAPCPFKGATKLVEVEGELNVRSRPSSGRTWGNRIAGAPVVEHDGELYVELRCEAIKRRVFYDIIGFPIPAFEIEPWLRPAHGTLRDYRLDRVLQLVVCGETYVVREA